MDGTELLDGYLQTATTIEWTTTTVVVRRKIINSSATRRPVSQRGATTMITITIIKYEPNDDI